MWEKTCEREQNKLFHKDVGNLYNTNGISVEKNVVSIGSQEHTTVLPLGAIAQYSQIQGAWWLYKT